MVMSSAEVIALKLLIHTQHLRILLRHPCGTRTGGRCQNHMDAALPQPVNDLIQPHEIVASLLRLQQGP